MEQAKKAGRNKVKKIKRGKKVNKKKGSKHNFHV